MLCDEWWSVWWKGGRTRRADADAEGAAGAKQKTRTPHSDVGNINKYVGSCVYIYIYIHIRVNDKT